MADFDSLLVRLRATRKRQAEILATTESEIQALERLIHGPAPVQTDLAPPAPGRK